MIRSMAGMIERDLMVNNVGWGKSVRRSTSIETIDQSQYTMLRCVKVVIQLSIF